MSTFCLCLYFYFTFKVSTIDLTFCDCSLFAEYFYSIDQLLMKKYSDDSFLFQLSGFNLLKSWFVNIPNSGKGVQAITEKE